MDLPAWKMLHQQCRSGDNSGMSGSKTFHSYSPPGERSQDARERTLQNLFPFPLQGWLSWWSWDFRQHQLSQDKESIAARAQLCPQTQRLLPVSPRSDTWHVVRE